MGDDVLLIKRFRPSKNLRKKKVCSSCIIDLECYPILNMQILGAINIYPSFQIYQSSQL